MGGLDLHIHSFYSMDTAMTTKFLTKIAHFIIIIIIINAEFLGVLKWIAGFQLRLQRLNSNNFFIVRRNLVRFGPVSPGVYKPSL